MVIMKQRTTSFQIFVGLCLLLGLLQAADPEENRTETDEAEFRQGGIGQQLMSSYPVMGGLYGGGANAGGFQYAAAASNNAGSGYVNMLRNLYRPPSMGLTDKVKHWVKSFMNRRQYVKPYYSPSMSGLQYSADEFGGKPMFVGANGYKAISVPLRQLQKYYKPYYATGEGAAAAFQSQSGNGAAAGSSSLLSYSPSGAGAGLYGGDGGQFSGASSGLFGDGNAALFAGSSGSSANGGSNNNLFSSASNPGGSLFTGGQSGGLFSQNGGSGNIFSGGDGGAASALFGAGGLYGAGGGSPSSGSNIYQISSNPGSFSLDGSSGGLYGSESGNSPFYGSSSGSRAAASALLSSLNNAGSSNGAYGGDLYASGASPAATIYNPNQGDQGRGYGSKKSSSSYGGGNGGALYMSSSDHQRNSDSSYAKEPANSFNVDSSSRGGGSPQESHSYSVSFQPSSAQGKSYSNSNSGFQPVSFGSEGGFQGKSS